MSSEAVISPCPVRRIFLADQSLRVPSGPSPRLGLCQPPTATTTLWGHPSLTSVHSASFFVLVAKVFPEYFILSFLSMYCAVRVILGRLSLCLKLYRTPHKFIFIWINLRARVSGHIEIASYISFMLSTISQLSEAVLFTKMSLASGSVYPRPLDCTQHTIFVYILDHLIARNTPLVCTF